MKILAFGDLHGDSAALRELKKKAKMADVIVCSGDISVFERNLIEIIEKLDALGKPLLVIHGNHEGEKNLAKAAEGRKNITFIHGKAILIDNVLFMGYGGGGFDDQDPEMYKHFRDQESLIKCAEKKVFIFHAPPHNTEADLIYDRHNGSKTEKALILKYRPQLAVCGHFHETFGTDQMIHNTRIINPGPFGVLLDL